MFTRLIAVALAVTISTAPSAPDPCALLTNAEISAALGATPSPGAKDGPDFDEDVQGTAWTCSRQVGAQSLWVSLVEFKTPAAAAKGMDAMMKASQEPEAIKLAAATGVGDRAVWGASKDGAMWVVLTGRHMFNVTVAGALADPAGYREPLRRLTAAAIARIPK